MILKKIEFQVKQLCRICLLVGFTLYIPAKATAQLKNVSGVVVDETGESLIGATLQEIGTNNSTVTNIDGAFILKLSSLNPVLEIRYVGYKTVHYSVQSPRVKITMQVSSVSLEPVVVVAYGTQKKITVTGAISSIGTEDIKKSSAPNITAAIEGKLPGLSTIQTNGAPGKDDVTLFLRGAATSNDQSPLILVDGIPRESIREIDANEVETITVLKDASSTAVFGVRGANGVILITTRRGKKGKVTVSPSVSYSVQSFSRNSTRRNSWEYARLLNEARENEGAAAAFSDAEIAKFDSWRDGSGPSNASDRYWYPNIDWQSIYFKNYAPMVRANVDISGGSEKLQYFINSGYIYQGGMYNTESESLLGYDPQAKMNRYNFRSNIDYSFNKRIKASFDLSSFIEKVNGTNGIESALWADAITARSTSPGPLTVAGFNVRESGTDSEGNVLVHAVRAGQVVQDPTQTVQSGYGNMNRSGYKLETRSGVNAISTLNVDLGFLTQGLSAKGLVSFESRGNDVIYALKGFVTYKFDRNPSGLDEPVYTFDGDNEEDDQLSLGRTSSSSWFLNMQAQLNYNRTFGEKHAVTAMALFQRDIRETSSGDIPYNMVGLSVRGTYAYDNRYLGEVNIGYNGTEQFAPSHRFGFFPAFSLGWVVSNESFMKDLTDDGILSKLKLRASIGKVGNDRLGSTRFLYLDNISYHIDVNHIPSLGNGGKISEVMLGNSDIHWETAWKQNYAIDFSPIKDLDLSFDYFIEDRTDILITRNTVPVLSGLTGSQLSRVNMGEIINKGYEISLAYKKFLTKNIGINVSGNFSYTRNKVISTDEAKLSEDYTYRYRETGYSLGQNWGYVIDYSNGNGFFNSKEDIENSGLTYETGGGTPLPGDFIYKDLNGDHIINEKDMAPIKYSSLVPRINYGLSLGGSFYGADVTVMFQGVGQYSKYYSGWGVFEEMGSKYYLDICDNRWTAERYANGEKITHPRLANSGSTSHIENSYYIMDASYIRLKRAEIGYTFPAKIIKKMKVSNMRVSISGDNIYTWTKLLTKAFDPEQSSVLNYPLMRTFSCGLNFNF
ncbi:MAG: TonB-dependent receptor [Paludibacter sp.]|nr:TonB-dependent receptor [Paludibacter sp.]